MKIDMTLKSSDVVLLKVLACVLIGFFMIRFLIFPGIETHQDLVLEKEEASLQKQEMQYTIDSKEATEQKIVQQKENLETSTEGFYALMENSQVDALLTGLALKHDLFPVFLNIDESIGGIPLAYQEQNTVDAETSDENAVYIQYVNTVTATLTLQGTEAKIREFQDDIARNYPGIQVRSFDMQESTYVDGNLQKAELLNCDCVLAVYMCGENTNVEEGSTE